MLKLKPVFFKKIWGGNKISNEFNLNSNKIGEAWIVSGYEGKASKIINGEFKGKTLDVVYKDNRNLFGNYDAPEFPLLIKLIHAQENLSIQVHPDDEYAKKNEDHPFGKYESWHILEAPEGTEIIVGHSFENSNDLQESYDKQEWDCKFPTQKIKPGDTFDITPGTVHAICKNTYLYEIQQSSDTTYRLYDYGRLENGHPRELHIKKSKEAIDFNKKNVNKVIKQGERLVTNKYFTLDELIIKNKIKKQYDIPFLAISCIEGEVLINSEKIKKNESVIITKNELSKNVIFNGNGKLLIGYPK